MNEQIHKWINDLLMGHSLWNQPVPPTWPPQIFLPYKFPHFAMEYSYPSILEVSVSRFDNFRPCYLSNYLTYKPNIWCASSPGTLQCHPCVRHLPSVITVKWRWPKHKFTCKNANLYDSMNCKPNFSICFLLEVLDLFYGLLRTSPKLKKNFKCH